MKLSVFYDHILQASAQTGKDVPVLLQGVRDAGIEAVEINMSYLCENNDVCAMLQAADLKVSCVYEFYQMDQKDETEKVKRHIETAQKAGAGKILVVPGFLSDGEAEEMKVCFPDYEKTDFFLSGNDLVLRMADGLAAATEYGRDADVCVTVEDFDDIHSPLSGMNGLYWFLNRIPGLGGTFDTGNFIVQKEDVKKAWELLKKRIVHIHCKDRGVKPLAVGDGYIPMKELLTAFEKEHYEGYLAIEHFDASCQETCMKRSADFLRRRVKTDEVY